ncbi:MAG: hypothetical protein HDT39_01540 [Lachnospiraceae bacterium]|nr:hypothetical protein [Lachnospiraceae bacterium]
MHIIDETESTLRETSYDNDNNIYMVDSQLSVCPFDIIKEWYISNKIPYVNPNPKSNDALYFGNEECFFIEFKNGKIDNSVNFELNKKIYDSLLILFDLKYSDKKGNLVDSISYTRANMNYILVYNGEKYLKAGPTIQTKEGIERQKVRRKESKHRTNLYKTIRRLANEEFILFGLDQFKNYLFKNVHTYTVEEFKLYFLNKTE